MKESLRRIILFAVTVTTGSVMILFDLPPVLMVPLLVVVGFVLLLGLGAITVADIKDIANSLKPANLKKISILKRLDEMKFFEKTATTPPEKQKLKKTDKTVSSKEVEKKPGLKTHLGTLFSSFGSLGTVLKERSKQGKKVEEINKLLDKTVNEKVSRSALASAGNVTGTAALPDTGKGGAGTAAPIAEQDPFLSLSGDEFDAGLLDGLDEMETGVHPDAGTATKPSDPAPPVSMAADAGIPAPSLDLTQEADEILKGNAAGLEEFSGLEGGETIDEDFGDLGDVSLDDVSLDDVSLDEENDAGSGSAPVAAEMPEEKPSTGPSGPAVREIKTDWVKSDAPQHGEDQVSTQADMAAFASGSGTDDDLLSSIASDVKHVKKEKDISLLRDLKDFKAPAEEIEKELSEVYNRINAIPKPEKTKAQPTTREIK